MHKNHSSYVLTCTISTSKNESNAQLWVSSTLSFSLNDDFFYTNKRLDLILKLNSVLKLISKYLVYFYNIYLINLDMTKITISNLQP